MYVCLNYTSKCANIYITHLNQMHPLTNALSICRRETFEGEEYVIVLALEIGIWHRRLNGRTLLEDALDAFS